MSLDAPTVAALWVYALCRAAHVAAPPSAAILIGLGTWFLYVLDRILDGLESPHAAHLRERHHFHAAHRATFAMTAFGSMGVVVWLALNSLPRAMLRDLSVVLIFALGYFALVHAGFEAIKRWFPKELAVGFIFAAAVAVPAWSQAPVRAGLVRAVPLLGVLFSLNCMAIDSWESATPERGGANGQWERWRIRAIAGAVAFVGIGFLLFGEVTASGFIKTPGIYFSIAVSAAMLFALDGMQKRISPLRLRIAADAALLTPLLLLALNL